ncbi:MAG: glycogen debranching protein GlgX [Pseudomonadota bacterium]
MKSYPAIGPGQPAPIGATPNEDGTNFAVFSTHATRVELCLFDEAGGEHRIDLPERAGDIWYGFVSGIKPGQRYGYRAHGPYRPDHGHRFNPSKLLLDPYARSVTGHPAWNDALMGYTVGAKAADLSFDRRDSAAAAPRSIVVADPGPATERRPETPPDRTVIYEAHVKGLTRLWSGIPNPGTYEAVAADPVIEHLLDLGVTAIELLPVHAFLNDRFLVDKGLTNYWGYQSLGFFAPDPRYAVCDPVLEFRNMVRRLHEAGLEVILDVVYNHSGEGDHTGPTLSFRGLDNLSYYRLMPDPRYYVNDTGTGNTLRTEHPMVMRMVMDSLRYWVEIMGVDGFRFDLGAALGRVGNQGFQRDAPLFQAMRQDPVLSKVKLIAEPWDIGPGGYQLGAFTSPFMSWNDRFRDGVRRFWRGDPGRAPDLASRVTGSALEFDHSGRAATSSVNMLTAHDGFTLEDVVSFSRRHNKANGEDGRDGHSENFSDNMGFEGETTDPGIRAARLERKRAMMATLLFSQGTPMILAGDEIGNSQGGNNNAYNQDNPTAWIDWDGADWAFRDFVKRLIALRKAHPILSQRRFLHSRERVAGGLEDLFWRRADGTPMDPADWHDPMLRLVAVEMRTAAGTPAFANHEAVVFVAFNAGDDVIVTLPACPPGTSWVQEVDSSRPDVTRSPVGETTAVAANSVVLFALETN